MKIQNVKGGYDYTPQEQRIRNYINDTLRSIFERFGYNPIETPILCYYDILSDKYDDDADILKEIYKLKDQGNRELGLRYDLTVPFAKFIALNKNELKMPFKRYEIAKAFRDGPVKAGRDREFTQCDVDVVGIGGELIEAELLSIFDLAFKELNISIVIKYNNRKFMTGIILESGAKEEDVASITTTLDKLEKVSEEEIVDALLKQGLSRKDIQELLTNFKLSLEELSEKYANTSNELIKNGLEEINSLTNYLDNLGLLNVCRFTPSLARGQNYYTGNVFEVYDADAYITSSIGAGGRYDKMITNFIDDGNSYPAVGISFGLSALYEILKKRADFSEKSNIDFYVIPMNTKIESLRLANILRKMDYKVDIEVMDRKVKKSIAYADKEKIPYVIILGEDEINNGKFKIKDMLQQKEIEISFEDIEKIREII
ncbi:MAG: histidine--tRNA ligase [Bacilli bacterium]|nr:histidine--tRNA ligase [Bacilli bacterium]